MSAFAQVTITGNLDFAGAQLTGSQAGAKGSTISSTIGVSSTSVINLDAIEDIGGGSKVQVHYGLDPRSLANDALKVTNNNVSGASAASAGAAGSSATSVINVPANTTTGLSRDEVYIGIDSATFGKLMLGAPNSIGLDTHSTASPLGTGVGSGYAPQASTMTNAIVTTRYDRSVRYNSAPINGISVQLNYAPGGDNANLVAGSGLNVAQQYPNNRKATEFGLSYANGPLNARFTNVSLAAQTNATGWYAIGSTGSGAAVNYVATKTNMLSANYALGATTLYYGYTNGDLQTSTTTATKGVSTRYAVKYDAGSYAVTAQRTALRSTTSDGTATDSSVTGLRADYPLSKTAKVYAGYEYWNTGATAGVTSTTTGDRKLTSIGLQKSF